MPTLTTAELTSARNRLERSVSAVTYTKPLVNVALQAIEQAMTTQTIPALAVGASVPQYLSGRIDQATAPYEFAPDDKRRLFAIWAELKFQRDK